MQPSDAFLALAQFSLALAGFTGVVIAFGWRDDEWHAADAFRTWRALVTSLACAFLSLVPIGLELLGVQGAAVWRWSSAAFSAYALVWARFDAPEHWRLRSELREVVPVWGPWLLYGLGLLMWTSQILNALGVWYEPQPGVLFAGLLLFLLLPALIFARIPFVRPKRSR
jgi:hypothetical protein